MSEPNSQNKIYFDFETTGLNAFDCEGFERQVMVQLADDDRYVQAASKLFKIPPEEVTPKQRERAKEIAIMLAYGTPPNRIRL